MEGGGRVGWKLVRGGSEGRVEVGGRRIGWNVGKRVRGRGRVEGGGRG